MGLETLVFRAANYKQDSIASLRVLVGVIGVAPAFQSKAATSTGRSEDCSIRHLNCYSCLRA